MKPEIIKLSSKGQIVIPKAIRAAHQWEVGQRLELIDTGSDAQLFDVALGVVLSFVSALVCIKLFLKAIDSIGMLPFVIYRLLLGMMLFGMLAFL